jgi:hypothetical protein
MMGSFRNPFMSRSRQGYGHALTDIRRWTAAAISDEEAVISVNEIACPLPDCPPRETIILILWPRAAPWKLQIHKAMTEVTESDVLVSLRFPETIGKQPSPFDAQKS